MYKGNRWYKRRLHYLLKNEAYTGTAVWGKTAKDGKEPDPVRVSDAWPAIISKETYDAVQAALHARAPKVQAPGRTGSKFLLSGLLRCSRCGKRYLGQSAKSGQFAYYVCSTLHRSGAGACEGRYLNAPRIEDQIVANIMGRILNEQTITELVQMVAEEVDSMAEERASDLAIVESDLDDVRRRLEKRRAELPSTPEIKRYVADFREFLQAGTIPERKALIRNFVKGIKVDRDEVSIRYTIPMPSDGATQDQESVLDFVQSGPPSQTQTWETTSLIA